MRGISLLKVLDDSKRMQIVVEAQAMPLQALVKRTFPRVAEGRVTDVVHQRQRLRKLFVQTQRRSDAPRDLLNLNGMSQPAAEVVGGAAGEDLRLPGKPAERPRLDDAFPVTLERASPGRSGAA